MGITEKLRDADASEALHESPSGVEGRRSWLLRQKVMLPDPVDGFVNRANLTARCDPTQRRVTAISAPGGFGKTTLLAEACRRIRDNRGVVAWLTLDEEDDPAGLATYLSLAFSEAGLKILDTRATSRDFEHGDYRVNLLIHSIEVRGFSCVLALDDVDRLRNTESLAIVNRLLHRGPPNLHVAMTFRELPRGIDVATPVLDGRGVTITAEDLRFEQPDIARFFDTRLSRRELAELTDVSQGWPIALCIHRNVRESTASTDPLQDIASNWIEARLWRGVSQEEHDFVLDIGLFDWIEDELVDEVLPVGSMRRARSVPVLAGLTQSVGGTSGTLHLHPLIRQYCADKRFRETPDRYRSIHRAIANALARRDQIVAAMRHAAESGDSQLVGEILEAAGGLRFWLRHGLTRMRLADELLSNQTLARFPRLGLSHCMALVMDGKLDQALHEYAELDARTDGFTRDRDGGNDSELEIDHVAYRYLLVSCGCQRIGAPEVRALETRIASLAEDPDVEPLIQAVGKYALCEIANAKANFDLARRWGTRARAELVRRSRYMTMFVDFELGGIAMAQGRVSDAVKAYSRARRAAKGDFLEDPGPSVIAEVRTTELDLERNRTASLARRSHKVPGLLAESGAGLDVYAAAAEITVELALNEGGPAAALNELDEAVAFARRTERATLWRCLLALQVSLAVADGRAEDAQRLWARAGLPREVDELVDLENQTWREMEAISCAALRLLTAQAQFDAARNLAQALLAESRQRGLKRTLMRGLALAMVLEQRAGKSSEARAYLVEYVRLFADTDYARPLLQEREVVSAILESLDKTDLEPRLYNIVSSLNGVLEAASRERNDAVVPTLTVREREILQRLDRWRDKEIGAALDLSEDGVRYHVKKIFQKLGARNRFEATHRARSLGIFPMPNGES